MSCVQCHLLRAQLEECSKAARGVGRRVGIGDYGWSLPYQDVLLLRRRFEKMMAEKQQSYHFSVLGIEVTLRRS